MLGATEVAPAGCKPVFTYRASEHPHIKVVTRDIVIADMSNMQQHLEARNLDLELEMKVTTSYMSYHMDMIINHQLAGRGMKLHHMSRHTIKTKENRDGKCYADSIPAWIHNEPVRIQAGSHLVLQQEAVETVNCNNTYTPIFLAADGKTLLKANPTVQNITLHHLDEDYLHLGQPGPVEHENYGTDFLYTMEVTDYCANNPACGSYQLGNEPSKPFNLNAVTNKVIAPFNWFKKMMDVLFQWGSVCSALIIIFLWILAGVKITNMFWLIWLVVRDAVHATFNYLVPIPTPRAEGNGPETVPMKPAENGSSAPNKSLPTYYSATTGSIIYMSIPLHSHHQDVC